MPETKKPEIDETYRCPLSLKKIHKIVDPVLTPSGHIYERVNLVAWIKSSGGKDPIDVKKPLTVSMIVEGFAVKEIVKKCKKDLDKAEVELQGMKNLVEVLMEQNKLLKKQVVLATWGEHGKAIDKKLDKGSSFFASADRTKALQDYKDKVLAAEDDAQLKTAVQDTTKLRSKEISERRYFTMFSGTGDTTRVAVEFHDKVTAAKGW